MLEETILGLVTGERNPHDKRLVVGVDPGAVIRFVAGNRHGLVGYGTMKGYAPDKVNNLRLEETLEYFLVKFPNSVMVIDQGGDITPQRALKQKYPGRVFLCHYRRDRKTMQLITWGEGQEHGNVVVDRNRMIQLIADEAKDKRFLLYGGTKADWYDYWLHWSHIYRVWEQNTLGVPVYAWLRDGRDDFVHCTVYWRVGVDRFGESGAITGVGPQIAPNSYMVNPDGTADFAPEELLAGMAGMTLEESRQAEEEAEDDWRNV